MELFYSNTINKNIITLDSIESNHCLKVLRKSIGDLVNIVDGKGTLFKGVIISSTKKICKVDIKETFKDYDKKDYYIHIGISPLKNHQRIEWFIEKSVEIGIDEISFINCSRTIRKKINITRLYKTAISAMKQTLKAKLPKINQTLKINDFIKNNFDDNKFICHLEKDISKTIFDYKKEFKLNKSTCILIGPEGDFTMDEIKISKNNKFSFLSLGDSRLRTETAGIVACHLINIMNNSYE
tara:strand:- start:150 stop:869 length:720 start_codon:yes stop_codon:yes gene_type:complete